MMVFELGGLILLSLLRRAAIGAASTTPRRHHGLIAPAAGLRLPPFQVLAQCVAQPVLTGRRAVVRASIWLVGHGVLGSNGFLRSAPA
jgi:hypothetical protein